MSLSWTASASFTGSTRSPDRSRTRRRARQGRELVDELLSGRDQPLGGIDERLAVLEGEDLAAEGAVTRTALGVDGHRQAGRAVTGAADDLDVHVLLSRVRTADHHSGSRRARRRSAMLEDQTCKAATTWPTCKGARRLDRTRPRWRSSRSTAPSSSPCCAIVQTMTGSSDEISYSRFRDLVQQGRVTEVTIRTSEIEGRYLKGDSEEEFTTNQLPVPDDNLIPDLRRSQVAIKSQPDNPIVGILLTWVLPIALLFAVWYLIMRRIGGQTQALQFGRSRAKVYNRQELRTDVRRRRRCGRGRRRAAGDRRLPQAAREVPASGRRVRRRARCSSAARGAGRRCSRALSPVKPTCPSTTSPARSSWRCSSASARRASASSSTQAKTACAVHHLHRRARHDREVALGRDHVRRSRRARADAEPAARRDGRVRPPRRG